MSIIKNLKPFLQGRENECTVEYKAGNHTLLCSPQNRELFEMAVETGYLKQIAAEDGCTLWERGDSHLLDTGDAVWFISTFRD